MIAKRSLDILKEGIDAGLFSGAGFALLSKKRNSGVGTLGRLAFDPETDRVNRDTLFDVASLTKPLVTAMAILQLVDDGKIALDDSVTKYFPDANHLEKVTIKQLLTHTSGLPPIPSGESDYVIQDAFTVNISNPPGTNYVYSDTGYIILGRLIEVVSSITLSDWFDYRIAEPLFLKHSGFCPDLAKPIVATSEDESMDGLPHDPRLRAMAGIAGHAGLFASIGDIAAYLRALLGNGKALLNDALFETMFSNALEQQVGHQSTAFFTVENAYLPDNIGFSDEYVGHSGFTGCFILLDRPNGQAVALLTNRVLNTTKDQSEFLTWRRSWLTAASADLNA